MCKPFPIRASVPRVFNERFAHLNKPKIAVLLGRCYSVAQLSEARAALAYIEKHHAAALPGYSAMTVEQIRSALHTTRLLDALNRGRKGARKRLAAQLDRMLDPDIALAIVPSHDPWATDTPLRQLVRDLLAVGAEEKESPGRVDATACLVRHTKIKRIVFGGPSNSALHRRTIRLEHPERVAARRVLLLDDIAKSGRSLTTCRALLYEAGAEFVQAAALGRVVGGDLAPG